MERLNDIMARTTLQRQQGTEQSSPHATPSAHPQGQRPGHIVRRPLREQTAHLGPAAYSSRPRDQYAIPPRARGEQDQPTTGEDFSLQQSRMPTTPRPAYPHQRAPFSEPPTGVPTRRDAWGTPAMNGHEAGAPSYHGRGAPGGYPAEAARGAPGGYPAGEYSYPSMAQADVQEPWEDDTANMRYGDWENDRNDQTLQPRTQDLGTGARAMPDTSRAAARIAQTFSAGNRHLATRELHSLSDAGVPGLSSPHATRNLRDVQVPPTRLPAPPSSPQEPQRSQHFTQPLKPQTMMRRSQDLPPEPPRPQKPAPMRQVVVREQSAPAQLIPAPYTPPTEICPICKGAGFLRADVPFGHPNFGKPIACECKEAQRKEKRRRQLQDMSNLADVKNKSFENFRPNVSRSVQLAYQIAVEYAQDPQGWLVLIGPNGCGKTHLAAAIANQYLEDGAVVLFITVIDLLEHLRATFAPNSTVVYDQLFSSMREAGLLVLDDLGAQQSSPWANEKLFQLLNYRYNSGMPTIITTNNIGLQNIEERIRSRITDASLVTRVTFEGALDYRPQKSNPNLTSSQGTRQGHPYYERR